MIVKNEEKMLPRALISAEPYVDEIIIVDTGSTDGTVAVAEGFGAKVYSHEWEGDFSKHRNQSIGYGKGEWIFVLDADEELKQGSGDILRKAVRENGIDSIMGTTVNYLNQGSSKAIHNQIRVFRNNGAIRYYGIVHNQLRGHKKTKKYPIISYHYGYDLGEEIKKSKHERTTRLLRKQISKEPKNYLHRLNLAVCHSTNFEFKEAIREGLKAIRLAGAQGTKGQNLLWAYYVVSSAFFKLDDMANAKRYARKALELSPDHLDSYFVLALVYHQTKNWRQLKQASQEYFRILRLVEESTDSSVWALVNMANESWRIHLALGDCYLHGKKTGKASQAFALACSLTPDESQCFGIIGDCYRNNGYYQEAQPYYEQSLKHNPDNPELLFGLALTYKMLKDEEQYMAVMREMDCDGIERPDLLFEKGRVHMLDREFGPAKEHFERALRLDAGLYPAQINLALIHKKAGDFERALKETLKAIEIKPTLTDGRVNLGSLYYDMRKFDEASSVFEEVLTLDPTLVDVRMILCEIYILTGDVEKCVRQCDAILKELRLPRDMTLGSMSELAGLFCMAAMAFEKEGKNSLARRAIKIALKIDPQIVQQLSQRSFQNLG